MAVGERGQHAAARRVFGHPRGQGVRHRKARGGAVRQGRPARGGRLEEKRDDLEPADAVCEFPDGHRRVRGAAVRRREGHRGRDDARRAQPVPHLRRDAVRSHPLGGVHPPPADPRDDLDGQDFRAARRGAGHPRPARSVRGRDLRQHRIRQRQLRLQRL